MHYGILSGALWALDTTVLSIALAMSPFSDGTAAAVAFAAIVSSAFHDILCALWMTIYSAIKGQLGKALAAIKTRDGLVVAAGALAGRPHWNERIRYGHQPHRTLLHCGYFRLLSGIRNAARRDRPQGEGNRPAHDCASGRAARNCRHERGRTRF